MSNKYTIGTSKSSLFADAEPYHYGEGYPDAGYYLPNIGEDGNSNTTDIKIQNPTGDERSNGYSEFDTIPTYKINHTPLSYIKKGTFPLPQIIGDSGGDSCFKIVITYTTFKKIHKIQLWGGETLTDIGQFLDSEVWAFSHFKTPENELKKIGFVLVGGGGGGGGASMLDADKDGSKSDRYTTPGGGGGGGEIVCGVLDVTYPEWAVGADAEPTEVTMEYIMELGTAGKGGASGNYDGVSHNDPHYGFEGKDGTASKLSLIINGVSAGELATAAGGGGGEPGQEKTGGTGGAGGQTYRSTKSLTATYSGRTMTVGVICNTKQGGKGGSPDGETMKSPAFAFNIFFSKTEPPVDNTKYCIKLNHAESEGGATSANNYVAAYRYGPGGHSFSRGPAIDYAYLQGGCGGMGGAGEIFTNPADSEENGRGGKGYGAFYY
jgi:hypothetical protein